MSEGSVVGSLETRQTMPCRPVRALLAQYAAFFGRGLSRTGRQRLASSCAMIVMFLHERGIQTIDLRSVAPVTVRRGVASVTRVLISLNTFHLSAKEERYKWRRDALLDALPVCRDFEIWLPSQRIWGRGLVLVSSSGVSEGRTASSSIASRG